jgi:hypothetical protein
VPDSESTACDASMLSGCAFETPAFMTTPAM